MTITKHKINYHALLVRKVLLKNRRACNELYWVLLPIVKKTIRKKVFRITGLEFECLAHDIVTKIFEKLSQFNQQKNLPNWAFRVAVNEIIDKHRRKKKQVKLLFIDPFGYPASIEEIPAGEDLTTDNNTYQIVKLLEELPIEKRELFCWYFTGGKTLRNLSVETGKSEGAVSSQIFRTKKTEAGRRKSPGL